MYVVFEPEPWSVTPNLNNRAVFSVVFEPEPLELEPEPVIERFRTGTTKPIVFEPEPLI